MLKAFQTPTIIMILLVLEELKKRRIFFKGFGEQKTLKLAFENAKFEELGEHERIRHHDLRAASFFIDPDLRDLPSMEDTEST